MIYWFLKDFHLDLLHFLASTNKVYPSILSMALILSTEELRICVIAENMLDRNYTFAVMHSWTESGWVDSNSGNNFTDINEENKTLPSTSKKIFWIREVENFKDRLTGQTPNLTAVEGAM